MADSPSQPRVKRQRVDKHGRFAALQKLKDLKAGQKGKHKVDLSEDVDNVYDVVDEKEYAKRNKDYGNDWIEDDGTGIGYVEDGRDIFEDEGLSSGGEESTSKSKGKNSKKRSRDDNKVVKGKGSIRNLFSNAVPKKKKDIVVNLKDDNILADILGELDTEKNETDDNIKINDSSTASGGGKKTTKSDALIAKEYMQNFMNSIKRKDADERNKKTESSDDEMIERILKPKNVSIAVKKDTESLKTVVEDRRPTKPKIEDQQKNNEKEKLLNDDKLLSVEADNKATKSSSEIHKKGKVQEEHENDFSADHDDHFTDHMDYSILNEDENQFEDIEKSKKEETKLKKSPIKKVQEIEAAEVKRQKSDEDEMKNLLNNWENICQMDNFDDEIIIGTSSSLSPPDDSKFNDENLKFFYWDAWEDSVKRPGEVFLFGKLNSSGNQKRNDFKSICVHVQNVERVLYLLPREYILDPITKEVTKQKVTLMDVYKEFEENISPGLNLQVFKSQKIMKNFAFHLPGVDVPESCEYIEIRYEGKKPAPNPKIKYNSIAHIFGTNTSFLETFLLERKIKGPGWLNITNFRINEHPLSWCKIEAICPSPLNIILSLDDQKTPPPPISLITLNIRSALNAKTQKNEIVMISCLVNNNYCVDKSAPNPPFNRHFCGFTRSPNQNWPLDLQSKLVTYKSTKCTKHDTERALLSWFLASYQNIDPDLIVTHDINDLQLDLLCDRISQLKIPIWSRLGRLRMSNIFGKKFINQFFIGRMICDVKSSAEELIKSRSYDLNTLCSTVLKLKEDERMEITNDDLYQMYESSDGLLKLITLTMQDCSYILRLMCDMNVLPLALQITNICGNLMSRTLQGGRSERNEFLLLHAFNEKNYIVPDKKKKIWNDNGGASTGADFEDGTQAPVAGTTMTASTTTRKKAAYAGGLVLEPIKGFYDKYILLMDFNSLYPSIIQEFNICFTTVQQPSIPTDIPVLPDSGIEPGILPNQIRRLVESRREVKKLMSTSDLSNELKQQYNIRQLALKLTANSMYGCLGFAQSRFFAQYLASLVTHKGREILMNTKSIVEKLNFQVIYGDTDSIMINTNSIDYDQVFKIGSSIKQTINKIYRQIELDIDGVFKYLLLLKKKKYAAITISKNHKTGEMILNQEHKGLDIVRRDWSQISVMAGKIILNEILSDNQLDEKIDNIHQHLEKFKQNIIDGTVPIPLLTITKQLTKPPKEYSNAISLPHVLVAKRMNETRNKRYKKGDMVGYIICDDGTDNAAMQRAYHIDELKINANNKLKIDTNYYLSQQIHPVVSRMCEPLEGTDGSRIAQCLGLDPNKFKAAAQKANRDEGGDGISITKTNLQKYRQCEKFTFTCVSCKKDNTVASAFKPHEKSYISILQKCSNDDCKALPYQYILSIRNQMILTIRKFIKRFYDNWMICDEPTCNTNTRVYSHVVINNRPVCIFCKQGSLVRSYSERDLYHQISYFYYMFDLSKHEQKNITVPVEVEIAYNTLRETIEQLLEKSAYCSINLNKLFASLKPSNKSDIIVGVKSI